jgi:hypothetical protein
VCVDGAAGPGPAGVAAVDEDKPAQPSSNTVAVKLRIAALFVTKVARIISEVHYPESVVRKKMTEYCMPPVAARLTGFWVSLFEQESSGAAALGEISARTICRLDLGGRWQPSLCSGKTSPWPRAD